MHWNWRHPIEATTDLFAEWRDDSGDLSLRALELARAACGTGGGLKDGAGVSTTGTGFFDFFTGGGLYMPRTQCLVDAQGQTDWLWVTILLVLTGGVVLSYMRIFVFWMRCHFGEAERDRNSKLFDLGAIFLLCAICGYALSMVMFFWPGYRLLAGFLLVLNFFSWRFCTNLAPFRVAFRANRLERELREEVEARAVTLEAQLEVRTAALRESEQQLRRFVDNLPGVAFRVETGERARVHFVSDGIELLTGHGASEFMAVGGRNWAELTHPDDRERARVCVARAAESGRPYSVEYRITDSTGEVKWVLERGQRLGDADDGSCIDGLLFDITHRRASEEQLRRLSMIDRMTGLPNRALLMDRLRRCLHRHRRDPSRHYAVLFLDFDRFKLVNDSLGHEAGDELLRQIASRLRSALRPADTVSRDEANPMAGRLGGDEFVVILDQLQSPDDAVSVADRLLEACRAPYMIGRHEVLSSASIGIVTSDVGHADADEALRDADTAMYQAKLNGRGCAVLFDTDMRERSRERLRLQQELRSAIPNNELSVFYQPIVRLESGECVGAEALVRWNNPRRGPVSPAEFIPIAEESGMITEIGEWVLRVSVLRFGRWVRESGPSRPLRLSVNLSRSQLSCPDFAGRVDSILMEAGLEPSRLQLEITENQAASSGPEQVTLLRSLCEMGVTIAMDDFGTGLSSLSELHRLPIDVLKIDRTFVSNLDEGRQFMNLARSIVEVASNMGMRTVAEGIETRQQLSALQALGCDYGQGFLFGRPMDSDEFEKYLFDPERDAA